MERPALNLPRIQSRKITLDGVQLWNLNRSTTEEIFLLAVSSSGMRTGMEWKWEPFWILCRLFPYWKMSFKHQRLLLPHMWFVWLTIKLLSNSPRDYFLVNHSFTVPSFEKFWWVNSSPSSLFFTFNDKGGKEERDWEGLNFFQNVNLFVGDICDLILMSFKEIHDEKFSVMFHFSFSS